jgi:putative transposase
VIEGAVVLNKAGELVESVWNNLPKHYRHIVLDAFIIMPNHVHLIILIDTGSVHAGLMNQTPTENEPCVGAQFIASAIAPSIPETQTIIALGKIIRSFKAKCTFLINQTRQTQGVPVWQRGYYDHIVRNEADLARIQEYIARNPAQWALDENNPMVLSLMNAGLINQTPTENEPVGAQFIAPSMANTHGRATA